MLTAEEATEVAKAEFTHTGRRVSDYTITVETYHADRMEWIVWFAQKGPFPMPGGTHAVRVHKSTGRALFMPGE